MDNDNSLRMKQYLDLFNFQDNKSKIPKSVLSFFITLVDSIKPASVLIPFATGEEVIEVVKKDCDVDYCNPNSDVCKNIAKQTNHYSKDFSEIKDTYDLIISDLPFSPVMKDALNLSIVENSCNHFHESSIGAFTFANNITSTEQGLKWIKELDNKGGVVSAVIDLPGSTYAPMTIVDSRIILISKKVTADIMIAKIQNDNDIEPIISNYLNHTDSSQSTRQGKWVQKYQYTDYSMFENANRRKKLEQKIAKSFNGELKELSMVCISIESPKEDGFNKDVYASVYIPKFGKSAVVTKISEFEIKAHNYFRVIVNQDEILPEFLAFVLNTELGIELRLRAMGGSTIPFLNTNNLKSISIPVPIVDFQKQVLELNSELDLISQEIARLKDNLQTRPAAYKDIRKQIKDINNRGDKFEQWFESLPYPLSTILKRFQVASDEEHRQEMLLFFFEAYSIFEAALLIGAYGKYYKDEEKSEDIDPSYFEKAQFGSWVKMDRSIAKIIRADLDDYKMIDKVFERFHTDDRSVISVLSSKDICTVLQNACDYRNVWHGHSGITGESVYSEHVRVLEEELARFQKYTKDAYENIQLIRPVSLKHSNGEFINTVEILTGSNPSFKKCIINGEALDDNKLYIRMLDTNEMFELPPLLLMKQSPASIKNACYFYNRIEGDNSRYISYHFEEQSDDYEHGEIAYSVIKSVLGSKE